MPILWPLYKIKAHCPFNKLKLQNKPLTAIKKILEDVK